MSVWRRANPSQWVAISVLALCLCVIGATGVGFFLSSYELYQSKVRLEPQIGRLKGLAKVEKDITNAAQTSANELSLLTYSAEAAASAQANNMQQSLRELFSQAGVIVNGSQILPVVEQDYFNRIRVRLTVSSDIEQLTELLLMLASQNPIVVIDTLEVKPKRQRRTDEQVLNIDIVLSSFAQASR
ncbi:type II secretion system protein GspM [uncultured Gilvimarinus sp.]|uniref:type II secretion system protein GspM n=1 Tax=uncultured Gilvimarinus sp. TaxID=1689143 RepID=UPI0030DC958B